VFGKAVVGVVVPPEVVADVAPVFTVVRVAVFVVERPPVAAGVAVVVVVLVGGRFVVPVLSVVTPSTVVVVGMLGAAAPEFAPGTACWTGAPPTTLCEGAPAAVVPPAADGTVAVVPAGYPKGAEVGPATVGATALGIVALTGRATGDAEGVGVAVFPPLKTLITWFSTGAKRLAEPEDGAVAGAAETAEAPPDSSGEPQVYWVLQRNFDFGQSRPAPQVQPPVWVADPFAQSFESSEIFRSSCERASSSDGAHFSFRIPRRDVSSASAGEARRPIASRARRIEVMPPV
jgi:hypothetical protein